MKEPMKTKLRIRFVLLSLAALLVLQGLIVTVSIHNSYADLVARSDALLEQVRLGTATNVRYFSVKADAGGSHIRPDAVHFVSLSRDAMTALAEEALHTGKSKGFVSDYRYHVYTKDTGVRILFLSRSASLEMYRTAGWNLIQISLAGLGVMAAVLIAVSGWVVTPLVENHKRQKQFITAASHELRTPLTVISTDAQMLRLEVGDSAWLEGILQQVDHLSRMIQDLVTLAKAEEYNNPLERETFSLSGEVTAVLDTYAGVSGRRGICLTRSVQEIPYCGSRKELHQLLCALLDNVFKYCPPGGKAHVTLNREKRGVCLRVSNTVAPGMGAQLPQLSQRFCRGENAAGTEGFGLGLSIAQAIAKRHKGNLAVKLSGEDQFLVEVTLP